MRNKKSKLIIACSIISIILSAIFAWFYNSKIVNITKEVVKVDNKKAAMFIMKITVDPNGGTWRETNEYTVLSEIITSPPGTATCTIENPTRDNYVFSGWEVSGEGASMNGTTLTYAINGDFKVTLKATWKSTYTVVYNGNGSTGGSTANSTPDS